MGPYTTHQVAQALAELLRRDDLPFGIEADGVPRVADCDVINDEPNVIGIGLSNGDRFFIAIEEI